MPGGGLGRPPAHTASDVSAPEPDRPVAPLAGARLPLLLIAAITIAIAVLAVEAIVGMLA